MIPFIVAIALALPTYLLWAYVHELCHVVMADHLVGVRSWSITVIPHRHEGSWRWAETNWSWSRDPSPKEYAAIHLAPRIANLIPLLCLPAFSFLPVEIWPSWVVVFGGGLIDLWVGSWGSSGHSDLQRSAKALDISPWVIRAVGWAAIVISVATATFFAVSNWC